MTALELDTRAAPGPVPPGRGRWRLTLHNRQYAAGVTLAQSGLAELVDARSRSLSRDWNSPAGLTFTLNGRAQAAAAIRELATDVIAWRWDDDAGADRMMFRGPIVQTQDQLTEQSHTINVTCADYLGVLARRYLTAPTPLTFTQADQDNIVAALLTRAISATTGSGTSLAPGAWLPLTAVLRYPNGTARGLSGQLRDRQYLGSQEIGQAIDDLANVVNGFEYDVDPQPSGDLLRLFYPTQGVTRADIALVYGASVATVDRTVTSSSYANYVRVLGDNASTNQADPQLYAEAWNSAAADGVAGSVGLWMMANNASDVNQAATLNEKAAGDLAFYSTLIPSYTLGLRPGWYRHGDPGMGDTVPLVIASGRLNVNSTVRVLGFTWDIGDDGDENVSVTVGRPEVTLAGLLGANRRDINALARR